MGMAACGGSSGGGGGGVDYGGTISGTDAVANADLQAIAARLDGILALGYNGYGAESVFKDLVNDVPLFVVDIRDEAAFDAGHIPGAVNIPVQDLPMALLENPSLIPNDVNVVVASDYGNDGNFANLVINAARILDPADTATYPYWCKSLTHGMNAWSFRSETQSRFDDDLGIRRVDEAGEMAANASTDQGAFPSISAFAATIDTVVKKILVRADDYINTFGNPDNYNSNAVDLLANLNDGNATNDPQIVSVRAASAYDTGHIPGAINIGWKDVAKVDDFTKFVDPTRPVVVYCYTGHTGSLATAALGILGYNVTNLLYGYNGWSTTAAASMQNFDATKGWDFPINPETTSIDTLADYEQPTGCEGCHTSLTAVYVDMWQDPPAGVVTPPSEGEG
jgi:rhodanese-related sulfurtransferase